MSYLSKLNFKTVTRIVDRDPVQERRTKFVGAAEEQRLVVAAALKGETYSKLLKPKSDVPAGSRQVDLGFSKRTRAGICRHAMAQEFCSLMAKAMQSLQQNWLMWMRHWHC